MPGLRDRETEIISYTSTRFFENQPNEICSQRRQKACLLSPRSSKITVTMEIKGKEKKQGRGEGKEKKEKKSNSCTISFYNSYFGVSFWPKNTVRRRLGYNVFKNPAKHIRQTRENEPEPRIDFKGEEGDV